VNISAKKSSSTLKANNNESRYEEVALHEIKIDVKTT
jgi:hypothetical protein